VWGDLAEVDNHGARNREGLWSYWEELITLFTELGFEGFRCDAAYQVPAELWSRLIARARRRVPDCLFFAETLGCRLGEIEALGAAGFDLIANSSKWWDFSDSWCLQQHRQFRDLAASVSFPESHDTGRLAEETGGLKHVQEQRYLFAAFFSAGLLMPIGYEYGFRKKLDVVKTFPEDWEKPLFDIRDFILRVNRLKTEVPILRVEGATEALWGLDGPVLCLRKESAGSRLLVLINKDWHASHGIEIPRVEELLGGRPGSLLWPEGGRGPLKGAFSRDLSPCEIVLILSESG